MKSPACSVLFAITLLLSLLHACQAFLSTPPSSNVRSFTGRIPCTPLNLAKKKRRRRKDSSPDDLPDFDLGDEDDAPPAPKKQLSPDEITDAMMGTSNKPLRSVKELVSDRSLEKNFQFDDPDDPLPDLAELAQKSKSVPVGKKKARAEARRMAAMEQEETPDLVEGFSGLLSQVPGLNSEREMPTMKILENLTWLGIFLLVAWEIYINSPLFDRAAPLTPIVYEFLM